MDDYPIVDAFPAAWLAIVESWPRKLTVDVSGYAVGVDVAADDLKNIYLPVLYALTSATDCTSPTPYRRVVAGLAGVPGSGKSTFAAVLARIADTVLGMGRLISVGMDGWHWPNAVLDVRHTIDDTGQEIPLRLRKGGPDSFDIQAIERAIQELRCGKASISLPIYDRLRHDPVPDRLTIGPGTGIILMEGNYILNERPPWDTVSELVNPKLFIEVDAEVARDRVIARHIRGGATSLEAVAKYETNDRMNAELILETSANADYLICLQDDTRIPGLRRLH